MSHTALDEQDGRRRRSDESRRRIALAMIDLVREGEPEPSADAVAARAGVGRRTVFRLFSDMEGVYREMHAAMAERLAPEIAKPLSGTTWRARLEEVISRRARVFDQMLPVKSAADAHRFRSKFLEAEHQRLVRLQREALRRVLPPSLSSGERFEALDLVLSFEAWRRLRQDQALSAKQALDVLRRAVAALAG